MPMRYLLGGLVIFLTASCLQGPSLSPQASDPSDHEKPGSPTDPDGPRCGDGVAADTEACDGDDLKGKTCKNIGYTDGDLRCDDSCAFDISGCQGGDPFCGDGYLHPAEECDPAASPNENYCVRLGHWGGRASCYADCTLDETTCIAAKSPAAKLSEALCDLAEQCAGTWGRTFSSRRACIEMYKRELPFTHHDEQSLASCTQALEGTDCAGGYQRTLLSLPECSYLGAPTSDGAECNSSCGVGYGCVAESDRGAACQVCRPASSLDCDHCTEPHLYCDADEGCRPRKEGDPCTSSATCGAPGLICNAESSCAPLANTQDPCQTSYQCANAHDVCFAGTCQDGTPRSGECTHSNQCAGDLICIDGVCNDLPKAGEPCAIDLCTRDASCHQGTCKSVIAGPAEPLSSGDTCADLSCTGPQCDTLYGTCALGYCDFFETFTCKPYKPLGSPCDSDAQCDLREGACRWSDSSMAFLCTAYGSCPEQPCPPGEFCNTNLAMPTCQPRKKPTEACTDAAQCITHACYGACAGGDNAGLPCTSANACPGGICIGTCASSSKVTLDRCAP